MTVVSTLAGGVGGTNQAFIDGFGTNASFTPFDVTFDASGNVFVADAFRIRKVTAGGGTQNGPVIRFISVFLFSIFLSFFLSLSIYLSIYLSLFLSFFLSRSQCGQSHWSAGVVNRGSSHNYAPPAFSFHVFRFASPLALRCVDMFN